MGFPHGKISGLMLAAAMLFGIAATAADTEMAAELGDGLKGGGMRLPVYDRDQLEFILSTAEFEKQGNLVQATIPVIDLIRPDADIDSIVYMKDLIAYPLLSNLNQVVDFWRGRPFSDALISAEAAEIDIPTQSAAGAGKVFVRSPLLDLDGVGFVADYQNRTVLVRSQVEMTIRFEAQDGPDLIAKAEAAKAGGAPVAMLRVNADSLLIDLVKNEIVLTGRVKLREARINHLICDKMVIYLTDRTTGKVPDGTETAEDAGASRAEQLEARMGGLGGVSRIVGTGNVEIDRAVPAEEAGETPQRITAGRMEYEVPEARFVFTEATPTIVRGADSIQGQKIVLQQEDMRAQVYDDCRLEARLPRSGAEGQPERPTVITSKYMDMDYPKNIGKITGDVRVDDIQMDLSCDDMTILLADANAVGAPSGSGRKTDNAIGQMAQAAQLPDNAGKEVTEIICVGNVNVLRKGGDPAKPEKAEAGQAVYQCREGKIVLSNGKVRMIRGKDSISGREMVILLNDQRLIIDKDSRIELDNWRENPASERTVIASDSSDLNYGGNELTFAGSVEIDDPEIKLSSDDMKIYLMDDPKATPAQAQPAAKAATPFDPASGFQESNKMLSRIVCEGNVQLSEARAVMDTGKLTLTFREKSGGGTGDMGGGSEIDQIFCDDGVKIVAKEQPSKDEAAPAKPAGEPAQPAATEFLTNALAGAVAGGGTGTLTAQRGQLNVPANVGEFHGDVVVTDTKGARMECRDLYLYARDVAPGEMIEAVAAVEEDPEFPQRIPLTAGKELVRIVAENDVRLDSVDPKNGRQVAGGDKAVYEVETRNVVLTGTQAKAYIIRYQEKQKVLGGMIDYDLNSGDYRITGDVTTLLYRGD